MFCDCGNKRSYVINTIKVDAGIRRQRRCTGCNKSFYTIETLFTKPVIEKKEVLPDARGLYTKEDVREIKRKEVETRRANADRAPSYFIEDDYD